MGYLGMEKVRLSLQVSDELNEALDVIAQESGTTKSDVLRRAVVLLKSAHEARKEGFRVGFSRDANKLDREVIGI
jgi:predicted transcriptional regulator